MAKKAAQQAANDVGAGHNLGISEADQRNMKLRIIIGKLRDVEDRMKPLREERKTIRAEAKADFKLSIIDAALRLSELDDMSIFVDEIKELIDVARFFNALPPEGQGDLFPDMRPLDERRFAEGKTAGMDGKQPEPPYGADSADGQEWLRGWHEGQRIRRDEMHADMDRRNAAKAELIKQDADPFPDPAHLVAE